MRPTSIPYPLQKNVVTHFGTEIKLNKASASDVPSNDVYPVTTRVSIVLWIFTSISGISQ